MNELDDIFEQLMVQEKNSSKELADALLQIDTLKVKCVSLSDENSTLKRNAFVLLKKLYKSYDEREDGLVSGDSLL